MKTPKGSGRWVDGWMDGWMDGWIDGWMDGLMDGWMDGWMDGYKHTCIVLCDIANAYDFGLTSIFLGLNSRQQC